MFTEILWHFRNPELNESKLSKCARMHFWFAFKHRVLRYLIQSIRILTYLCIISEGKNLNTFRLPSNMHPIPFVKHFNNSQQKKRMLNNISPEAMQYDMALQLCLHKIEKEQLNVRRAASMQ